MRIVAADIYDVQLSAAAFVKPVLLRLTTDEGIEGVGELALAYGLGREAGLGILREMVTNHVLNADPFQIETMWHTLFRRTFWGQGGGPVHYGGMSAIDHALWDIKGKALGVPAYELLGGKTRDRVRVYANGWYRRPETGYIKYCRTPEEYAAAASRAVADGYNALKFDPFLVDARGERWDVERLLPREIADIAYRRVAAVREAVGPDVDILVEVHGNLGVTDAIIMGRRLEELAPFCYEEPVDAMNVECMRKVAENVAIPIAAGERLYTRYGFRPFIEKQALDILQPDLGLAGGLTEGKKIAAHAETYNLHVQPHNCGGPVLTAVSVQFDACITNFIIQELFPYRSPDYMDLLENPLEQQVHGSEIPVPAGTGLGIRLNEEVIRRYLHTRLTI